MSSPSQPVNIRSRSPPAFDSATSTPSGTPDIRALRAQYSGTPPVPNIPARYSSPLDSYTSGSPSANPANEFSSPLRRPSYSAINAKRPASAAGSGSPADNTMVDLDDLPAEDKARVLRRHLRFHGDHRPSRTDLRSQDGSEQDSPDTDEPSVESSTPLRVAREVSDTFPIRYHAPGADVTHDIYKWHADQRRQSGRPRSSSYAGSVLPPNPAFEHIHEPGGFRRNYVLLQANEQGIADRRATNNFIDFLYIYGQFAGEDLEEEDEERSEDVESADQPALSTEPAVSETQPLLKTTRQRSRSRRRPASVSGHGDATVPQAVLMLLKSFVGTGVLFLGKAFANGGLVFSIITITVVALVSLYSFLLLIQAKFVVSGSFGDIGGALYGPWMRYAILFSIAISQIGFVTAYTIFVAENLQAFVSAVTHCATTNFSILFFICIQLVIFLPLALVRNLAKLSTTALVADAFILAGLIYIFGSEISAIHDKGIQPVKLFNSRDFPLFIGTAVFSFEGVGLVIPITDAMREPHKFPRALTGVMIGTLVLFGGAGALAYLAFGSEVKAVVLVNLDPKNKFTQAVQFLYSVAIILSIPLQFFPAARILENGLFVRSGKRNPRVKWLKNFFRFGLVMVCTAISWAGARDLDKFVALIGSFACIPLCFVYPAMLHYKAVAKTPVQKIGDIMLGAFGMAAMIFTTAQTIKESCLILPGPVPGGC
ncbi:amino acid transporter [Boletus edulis BED1]|uniref:Amino acid transporter n=1 Tax=Boletus edulis BED1 TaxID=1328754 RepID=A0AAD4GF59_BOLED|nr:amino acid transporter [Boletus edulis BED1]